MFKHQYAASTANTYVSALCYCHRLAGVNDPTKVFWVLEMLKGYGKLSLRVDTRLPITLHILRKARFPLGEFIRANVKFTNVIG